MKVEFYKSLWGMDESLEDACEKILGAGYDGVEAQLSQASKMPVDIRGKVIWDSYVETASAFADDLERASKVGAILLNVQAGRHWFTEKEGSEFFEGALRLIEGCGFPVAFETHRGRLLYSLDNAAFYLNRFPELRITADFSHWTCVSESMLEPQAEKLEPVFGRVGYIHARVGHEEGPQVPDPRAPMWAKHLETFESWWDRIGQETGGTLRVDPEFGPPNYLWTSPNGEPLADLWEVCLWMRDRLKARWA